MRGERKEVRAGRDEPRTQFAALWPPVLIECRETHCEPIQVGEIVNAATRAAPQTAEPGRRQTHPLTRLDPTLVLPAKRSHIPLHPLQLLLAVQTRDDLAQQRLERQALEVRLDAVNGCSGNFGEGRGTVEGGAETRESDERVLRVGGVGRHVGELSVRGGRVGGEEDQAAFLRGQVKEVHRLEFGDGVESGIGRGKGDLCGRSGGRVGGKGGVRLDGRRVKPVEQPCDVPDTFCALRNFTIIPPDRYAQHTESCVTQTTVRRCSSPSQLPFAVARYMIDVV